MGFDELSIEISYSSRGDNFLNNLIMPSLKYAKEYKRSVGFFSSSVLELLKAGLKQLIENDGLYKIICSPELSPNDVDSIRRGYEKKLDLQERMFDEDTQDILSKMEDEDLDMLAYLIEKGRLDIQIVDLENSNGIYHDKLGILEDKENNKIMFFGSPNESRMGYLDNYEKIRVFKSWEVADLVRIADEEKEFSMIWSGQNKYIKNISCNSKILDYAAREFEKRKYKRKHVYTKEVIELRDYQEEAIESWLNNGKKGFYVMATGTGKTWTAIYTAKEIIDAENVFLVICAPYKHLIKQWSEDVKKVFPDSRIVLVSSENPKWENELKDDLAYVRYSDNTAKVIAISTIKSFSSEKFRLILEKNKMNKMLIVDEAHRFNSSDVDIKKYFSYYLGLSATPSNKPNDEKAKKLTNYFGGEVYNLPIEYAINKGFLVHYNYYPILVNATEDDEKQFKKYTNLMRTCFKNNVCVDIEGASKYKRARLRVISMAEEKSSKIRWIISHIKENDHFIVYCGDGRLFSRNEGDDIRHIQFIKDELSDLGFKVNQFTATENMNERMQRVDSFNRGMIDSLVAIKCLDEGINIPSIKGALLLSSNDDYREFIQRRGRILRHYTDEYSGMEKRIANIYDVIVCPSSDLPKIAEIELRRFYEYARLADNFEDCNILLEDLLFQYNLDLESITNSESEGVEVELDE